MTIFSLFTFWNYIILEGHILNISKTLFTKVIFWSSAQQQTTLYFFARILYTFKVYNRSSHLVESVNIKDNLQFLTKHAYVGKFEIKKVFLIVKSQHAFYV